MPAVVEESAVRFGRVHGRYFRENFAQGGLDLAQVIAELVTNADAAIAAGGRTRGRIVLRFGPADAEFRRSWKRELRRLGFPALADWRNEVSCTDDGEGVDAGIVERRLGALGVTPAQTGQRGLFGRGLRDVWLAQGGGRIQGVRAGRAVEAWFFPVAGDQPYAFATVLDGEATRPLRRSFDLPGDGTRVTVPIVLRRPQAGRLRALVANLVQLRPVLEDTTREVWLELEGEPLQLVSYSPPEPDAERPLLVDRELVVQGGVSARVVVRRAGEPIPLGPSRATRRGGLVIRSGRAAHEVTLAGLEGRPGARHLYGEVWCDAIESLQRDALESARPQIVVKVDRSGLNENHVVVQRLYAAVERILRPIVEAEERRAGAHLVNAGREIKARDEQGLRALNDALRSAFDAPGSAGFARGGRPSDRPARATERATPQAQNGGVLPSPPRPATRAEAMRFKQSPLRMHPGEQRTVSLIFDPAQIRPGSAITIAADVGLTLGLGRDVVPPPGRLGWSRVSGSLRARVSVEPGSQLAVLAEAGGHAAELEVVVVRHRASGWVREIARKDEDAEIEATFDPESGIVTVFEGRREFKALERAARRAGFAKRRVREYLPYRMLEVEVAANAVYSWAAERVLERRLGEERPGVPAEYARAVYHEAQLLRYRYHEKLMRAFLAPEVFVGGVAMTPVSVADVQASLLD